MTTENTLQAMSNTSYVVNQTNGNVKMLVTSKKQEAKATQKPILNFAKNTRYSIYNNGGGYTGL